MGVALFGPHISQGQDVELGAGYVHAWGAQWVENNQYSDPALATGWKANGAWHFGADTVTHLSVGAGWVSMNWSQGSEVILSPADSPDLHYRMGTMETYTSQLCLTPELVVPLSRQFRFVFGADLGWLLHAEQHESGTETFSAQWHSPSSPGGTEAFAVDSTYDVNVVNPLLFGIHVGFEFIPIQHWSIRADATPMVNNIYGPDHSAQVPVYLGFTVGYRFIPVQG